MNTLTQPQKDLVAFRCNICGNHSNCKEEEFGRDNASCSTCGSTVRMRSVVHHVSTAIFGKSLALSDFPRRSDIRGVGFSDWPEYADRLAKKLNYTNTFYHTKPFLDITSIPENMRGSCDFLIATDVFEHIEPPVSRAFKGSRQLLKKEGCLILTVPFTLEESETKEHFSDLFEYKIEKDNGSYKLNNKRRDGINEVFKDLIFHDGPGSTLEMRLFAKAALERELKEAGFSEIKFVQEDTPEFGIFWQYPWGIPIIAIA